MARLGDLPNHPGFEARKQKVTAILRQWRRNHAPWRAERTGDLLGQPDFVERMRQWRHVRAIDPSLPMARYADMPAEGEDPSAPDDTPDPHVCMVCMDRWRAPILVLPCRHRYACRTCLAAKPVECGICRGSIEGTLTFYDA